ncbi:MAG: sulfatase [Planctomycetota bacterium]
MRYAGWFLLGFAPLALIDGLFVKQEFSQGGGLATLGLFFLGLLLGLAFSRGAPFLERLLPARIRGRPQAAFGAGLACALVPQAAPFFPGPLDRALFDWKWALATTLPLWVLAFALLGRLAARISLPRRPMPWGVVLFLLLAGGLEARYRSEAGARIRASRAAPAEILNPPRSPDVILLVLDTLRFEALGKSLEGRPLLPRLERFASRGRRFTRGYSGANTTPPGHATLFTGLYPDGSGTLNKGEVTLELRQSTLAEFMRRHGYRTAGVTSNVRLEDARGFGQGFEIYDDRLVARDSPVFPAVKKFFNSSFFRSLSGYLIGSAVSSTLKARLSSKQFGVTAADTTREALAVLDSLGLGKEQPLFLFVNFIDPHFPYESSGSSPPRAAATPATAELEHTRRDSVGFHRELDRLAARLDSGKPAPEDAQRLAWIRRAYWEQCRQLDEGVGALLEELDRRGRLSNAVVLITSDHGEHLGEHASFLHGTTLFEEQVRVPFLLIAPGLKPGTEAAPVSAVDFLPTVCRALGLEKPAGLPGIALQDPVPSGRPIRFESGELRGYLRGDRKWIARDDGRRLHWVQAFDLSRDPREGTNLIRSAETWVRRGMEAAPFQSSGEAIRQVGSGTDLGELGYADETGEPR